MDQGFQKFTTDTRDADAVLRDARRWLDELDDAQPYFLFIHLYDVHSDYGERPYDAPEPFIGRYSGDKGEALKPWAGYEGGGSRYLRAVNDMPLSISPEFLEILSNQYDEGLAFTDERLGRFIEGLDRENCWITVTADHGEEFYEHGRVLHDSLYDEVVRVPLILTPPRGTPDALGAPRRIAEQVRLVDLRPTLLDLARLAGPVACQGRSLMPWLVGREQAPSLPVELYHYVIRHQGIKVIGDMNDLQIYDIVRDPKERENLIRDEAYRERAKPMAGMLVARRLADEALRKAFLKGEKVEALPEDPEMDEHLRALGYGK